MECSARWVDPVSPFAGDPDAPGMLLFKQSPELLLPVDTTDRQKFQRRFMRIRCPLCQWKPTSDSLWTCAPFGTPEPPFDACGTTWNTFSTRGKCPGCEHQWTWTTCHKCGVASKHDEWYEEQPEA